MYLKVCFSFCKNLIAKELPGSEVPETNNGLMIGGLGSLPVVGNGNTVGQGKLLEWRS